MYQISVSLVIQFQDTKQLCTTLSTEILSNTQFTEVNLKSKAILPIFLYTVVVESLPRLKIRRLATYQLSGGPLLNTYNSLILLQIIIPKIWFTCSPTWSLKSHFKALLSFIHFQNCHLEVMRFGTKINEERIWYELFQFFSSSNTVSSTVCEICF